MADFGTINSICEWHSKVRPNPTERDFAVQTSCVIEEFAEMLEALAGTDIHSSVELAAATEVAKSLYKGMRTGTVKLAVKDRGEFLDALADIVVTCVGSGHTGGMNVPAALAAVDTSNYSKFDESGSPVFDEYGKLLKNPTTYVKADLTGFY